MHHSGMKGYLRLTGVIFAIVALGHALRLAFHWPVAIAGWLVPMWLSWVAVAVAGFLSLWAFGLASKVRR